jgi:DNA invertase Pin-like site-specific DNA recombinase
MDGEQRPDRTTPLIDVYARLSYAADGSTINVDEQVETGEEDVAARGGQVGKVFRDDSTSAWNPKVRRPDWDALMARLESGACDGVWVLDVTRFSRKVMEGERLVEAARRGRRVWSASGGYNLSTADGRKAFRDAMVTAAAESDKIAERTRRGRRRKAKRGVRIAKTRGFGTPRWEPKPAGWEKGDPRTPVPDAVIRAERDVVRECYRRLLAGETNGTALARELNGRGVRTVNGKEWTRTSLAETLLRPALAGLIAINGEVVAVEKNADPVVSRAEWERMRSLLRARGSGRPPGRRHFLSGLMRCGTCRRRLAGSVVRSLRPYPDGQPRREYRCPRGVGRAGRVADGAGGGWRSRTCSTPRGRILRPNRSRGARTGRCTDRRPRRHARSARWST